MTRRSSTVWGFMQKSVGEKPDLQHPTQNPSTGSLHLGGVCPFHHSQGSQEYCREQSWLLLSAGLQKRWNSLHISRQEPWVTAPVSLKSFFPFQ